MEYIIYYLIIGYVVNNAIALFAIYFDDGYVEVDFPAFIITIPAWPHTLYQVVASIFGKE